MKAYQDPENEGNSAIHHTGKLCIEVGCSNPAGTHWSPLWCMECNIKRIDRISGQLEGLIRHRPLRASE